MSKQAIKLSKALMTRFCEYHQKHKDWGFLAPVLQKQNLEDKAVCELRDRLTENGDDESVALARALRFMTRSQRNKIVTRC